MAHRLLSMVDTYFLVAGVYLICGVFCALVWGEHRTRANGTNIQTACSIRNIYTHCLDLRHSFSNTTNLRLLQN